MAIKKNHRITHKIEVPSYALRKFLRQTVFDEESYLLFMENSLAFLKNNGIELDSSVSEEALMQLRALVDRAHYFVVEEKIDSAKFEDLFGIVVTNPKMPEAMIKSKIATRIQTYADIYYAEANSDSHRGSNTEFKNHDALTETRSNTHHKTSWDGNDLIRRPEDRFGHAPLLDALSLGMLIGKIDTRLKELGA